MKRNTFTLKKMMTVAVLVLCTASFLTACGTKNEIKETVKPVKTEQAVVTTISTDVEYPSKLKPLQEIPVSPKMGGKVASVNVDVGAKVEKDQVLLTLDSKDLNAQLNQQKAGLDASVANYEKAKGSAIDQQLIQAKQSLDSAQIAYNNAKDSYDKNEYLYNSGAISKQAFDDAKQRYDNASVALRSASDNYNLIKSKIGPQTADAAYAQVNQAQAGVAYASTQIENTVIKSPISGVISIRNVDVGEIASSASPSFTIIDASSMLAEVEVPDKTIGKISKGQTIPVKVSALDNKTINGVVDTISPAADNRTQAYTIKVKIDNANNELKPGMFARVVIPAEKKDNVVAVPNEAIKVEDGVSYIYTVAQNEVKKVAVTIGLSNDKLTEITSGLKSGVDVITQGQTFLREGQKVSIAK